MGSFRPAMFTVLLLLGCGIATAVVTADQPVANTTAAFDRYTRLTAARVETELRKDGPYLWADWQAADRTRHVAALRRGEVVIASLETRDNGKTIEAPGGIIHHWIGTVFVPGVTLDQYLAFVKDYDQHQQYFTPYVQHSSLLERDGDFFRVLLRFHKTKAGVTAVHDTWHDVRYFRLSATRGGSATTTTKILEVENPGEPDEKHRSPEDDRGYLWRLDTWWRFEERDGGVYVQCESVSLSRSIPFGFGWLVGPFVKSIPRESLTFTLGQTRSWLTNKK
ncbi:MAG: hypothetical protein ACRD5G_02070 [Candidatus Acidiferrales bacterium]